MLGENHSIYHEFPDFHQKINELASSDPDFRALVDEHDKLDKQIRGLEMRESPIADLDMERLKKERIRLKDRVYHRLNNGLG
ncbi:MAG: YdcH family protein [Pseudomonadales bacterium]|nr:YdcH family protein [Pseudomonadales bacterium]